MHVVCRACATTNNVAEGRLQDNPTCGHCKQALLPAHPFALTDSSFSRFVNQTEVPIIVDFWAGWCGPCKAMAPQFEIAAQKLPTIMFAKVDTEENPRVSESNFIRSIPTLMLFHHGKEVAKQAGAMSADDLVNWINSTLGK